MKKLAKLFGVLLILFIGVALLVPLVVDVDKYRPQIVELVNPKLNGSLELGHLSLSLWGQVRITVAGLKLRDKDGNAVVSVGDAYFHLPLMSVLSGAPLLTFEMNQPTLNVVKSRSGKINLMSLMKPQAESPGGGPVPGSKTSTPAAVPSVASKQSNTEFPALVSNARLGIEFNHAVLNYRDDKTGLKSEVKDLNLMLKDISLSHPTEFEVWADLNTRMGQEMSLKGPVRLKGKATPQFVGTSNAQVSLDAKLDLDGLEISVPGFFEKKSGIAAHASLKLVSSETQAKIENLTAQLFNAELQASGAVGQLSTVPTILLSMKTNSIQLRPWAELIPLLQGYDLDGSTQLTLTLKGTAENPSYQGQWGLNSLRAKLPRLKVLPQWDATVNFSTDKIDNALLTLKAPGGDLKIVGKVLSFSHPFLDFAATSSGMDLDQWVDFPPPAKKGSGVTSSGQANSANVSAAGAQKDKASGLDSNYDALLSPLRENKILAATQVHFTANLKSLKAYAVKMNDLACTLNYKNMVADLKDCGLKIFSGAVKATSQMNFKTPLPTYSMTAQVTGLELAQAMESQMALFKNTMTGKAQFAFHGQGSSLNPPKAMASFVGGGSMKVEKAVFTTIDVVKMVKDGINQSIGKLIEKIPALKGKTLDQVPSHASQYDWVSSDFTIADQKFKSPNFVAHAAPNQGIDLKGSTTVGMVDYSLDTKWEVIDTYNLTHLRDISIDESGIQVPHVFAEGNSPVHFTVHAGCTVMAPCYSYTEVPLYLSQVALTNIGHALAGKAQDELRDKAKKLIDQVAPQGLPQDVKDRLKGLFH